MLQQAKGTEAHTDYVTVRERGRQECLQGTLAVNKQVGYTVFPRATVIQRASRMALREFYPCGRQMVRKPLGNLRVSVFRGGVILFINNT